MSKNIICSYCNNKAIYYAKSGIHDVLVCKKCSVANWKELDNIKEKGDK